MAKLKSEDELLQDLADVIDQHYERIDHMRDLDAFIGTDEIFEALQNIFPSPMYTPIDLTYILLENGFSFAPMNGPAMQYAWMIKRR